MTIEQCHLRSGRWLPAAVAASARPYAKPWRRRASRSSCTPTAISIVHKRWPLPSWHRAARASAVAFDLGDESAVQSAVDALLAQGPIQILVNSAGIHRDALMAGMDGATWHR